MSDFGRPALDSRIAIGAMIRKSEEKQKAEKKKILEDQKQRVRIEGKFGQGKNAYELNKIRVRKSSTSESMVSMIFFLVLFYRSKKCLQFLEFCMPQTELHTEQLNEPNFTFSGNPK